MDAKESNKYGLYKNKLFNHDYPKIQLVDVLQMFDGEKMNLPTAQSVVKSAKKKIKEEGQGRLELGME